MIESVIYQDILQKGMQKGKQEGKQEEALRMVMLQLTHRFGKLEENLQQRIQQLSITQLEDLVEALLDFSSVADLVTWLQSRQM